MILGEDILKAAARRFIEVFNSAKPISQFDVDLYFKLVEKITVHDTGVVVIGLFDGSELDEEMANNRSQRQVLR